jgi:hypothetical protein
VNTSDTSLSIFQKDLSLPLETRSNYVCETGYGVGLFVKRGSYADIAKVVDLLGLRVSQRLILLKNLEPRSR